MKFLYYIFLTLFFTTCTANQQEQEDTAAQNDDKIASYSSLKTRLEGEAQQAALGWNDYQNFMTAFENYDHSKKATDRLTELVDNMPNSIPAVLVEQPVKSRLVVLQSKLGAYKSAVRNDEMSQKQKVERYNQFILALNQFHVQLNEKLNYESKIDDLINTLRADFDQPLDSIPAQE